MRKFTILALLFVCVTVPATAVGPTVTILGPGALLCTEWWKNANTTNPDGAAGIYMAQGAWVLGYLSALAVANRSRVLDSPRDSDPSTIFEKIDAYCRLHPSSNIASAAQWYYDFLTTFRGAPK